MDNEEIKRIFDGLKEDFDELKHHVEKNIDDGKKEHKEIKDALRKLCERMTSNEDTVDNHLINSAKKEKSNKEKISYIITAISLSIAIVALFTKFN